MKKGTIFNIQHYAVHDGPGIRTLVFFKGCPLKCKWCCNPESHSLSSQLQYFSLKCKLCLECLKLCEENAISFRDNKISRNFSKCRKCSKKLCIENCNYDALKSTGRKYSVAEVMDIIIKDIDFYNNSGGGVTFSGGEPFSQPTFLREVLTECKKRNIHTAVETCGYVKKKVFRNYTDLIDLYLFDLKLINKKWHMKYTNRSNKKILKNLEFLSSLGKKVIIRLPLISSITDRPKNISAIAAFMKKHSLREINLIPYHELGVDKYSELGMNYRGENLTRPENPLVENIVKYFQDQDIYCEIV